MRYEIKELRVGGILDQAITLVKNHFKLLFLITFVLLGPLQVIGGLLALSAMPVLTPEEAQSPDAALQALFSGGMVIFWLTIAVNLFLAYPITNAALIHALSSEYLEQPTSVGKAFAQGFQVLVPLLATGLLVYLAIFGGMLLCIVPGILATLWFSLTTQVVVIERAYGFAALRRSRTLIRGNVGTLSVLVILLMVIQFGLNLITQIIPQPHLATVVSAILQSIVFIFGSAVWVVLYFSCRCKVENFDLSVLADAVGREELGSGPSSPAL